MEEVQTAQDPAARKADFFLCSCRDFGPEGEKSGKPHLFEQGQDGCHYVAHDQEATTKAGETGKDIMNLPNSGGGCHDDRNL
ncbi:hypothetical protein [Gluconobacter albidus]|uniref:Uncharacterized protein n=1 Tax=Gluconobacter albidus TaxID=318683 RepID=A0ABQ5X454_9PROT|nr:hypothetical protein [Gluconobacter albidus]GLQ69646.1 hypothetical protein GCM10007866_20990 [Gluconobacter albidus]